MKHRALITKINELLSESIKALGYTLIDVEILGKVDLTLQLFIEHLSGEPVTVDDCSIVSRHVSAILDVEDVIEASYLLEVSSPGIDRVLKKLSDFEAYLGFEVKVKVIERIDGRRSYRGKLLNLDQDQITIRVDNQDHVIAISNIEHAKPVLTKELIEFAYSKTKTKH